MRLSGPLSRVGVLAVLSLCGLSSVTASAGTDEQGESWPQFRGLRSAGLAAPGVSYPAEIGPSQRVIWKVPLPPGHSSPIVHGDRIFVTAVRDKKLWTIALDRETGKTVWEREAPHKGLETVHTIGSHAQPTPATDGERVVSFFGSCGLFCYSRDGKQLWHRPMGPFKNDFGAGNSPLIVDDWVILGQDHDTDSFLEAIDKRTGKTVWRTDRSEFARNYCSPILWEAGGRRQLVMAGTLRVVGYDLATGREVWTVRGIARTVCMTPIVGDNGLLYVAGWSVGGEASDKITVPSFDDAAQQHDRDGDKLLEAAELPDGPIKQRFTQVDRDKSGGVDRAEYEFFRGLFDQTRNVVLAVRPGGTGDVTASHVVWRATKFVPFCASPLYFADRVWTVKDGGIFSCFDGASGVATKQGRLPSTGGYYSSPAGADGKVYCINQSGQLSVIRAMSDWEVLHTAEFGEDVYASPALVAGRIYLRTVGHLYCLGD